MASVSAPNEAILMEYPVSEATTTYDVMQSAIASLSSSANAKHIVVIPPQVWHQPDAQTNPQEFLQSASQEEVTVHAVITCDAEEFGCGICFRNVATATGGSSTQLGYAELQEVSLSANLGRLLSGDYSGYRATWEVRIIPDETNPASQRLRFGPGYALGTFVRFRVPEYPTFHVPFDIQIPIGDS